MDPRTTPLFNSNEVKILQVLQTMLAKEKPKIASLDSLITLITKKSNEKKPDETKEIEKIEKIVKINQIRTELNDKLTTNELAGKENRCQLIHACLINLARYWPINNECPITACEIEKKDQIASAKGFQYDAESIKNWLKIKTECPQTREPFSSRDEAYIRHQLAEHDKKQSSQNEEKHAEETQANLPPEVESHIGEYVSMGALTGLGIVVGIPLLLILFPAIAEIALSSSSNSATTGTGMVASWHIGVAIVSFIASAPALAAGIFFGAIALGALIGLVAGITDYVSEYKNAHRVPPLDEHQPNAYSHIALALEEIDKKPCSNNVISTSLNIKPSAPELDIIPSAPGGLSFYSLEHKEIPSDVIFYTPSSP